MPSTLNQCQTQCRACISLTPFPPALELLYFPIRGRAEAVRLLLADNGVEFTDTRIGGDAWAARKPTAHFGQVGGIHRLFSFSLSTQMPVLYDDGFQVVQSNAILRHLGRKFNLYGSNPKVCVSS